MIYFSTILCVSAVLLCANVAWLQGSISYWPALRPCNKNSQCTTQMKSKKTVSKIFKFNRAWSWLFWTFLLGWLDFDCHVHTIIIRYRLCLWLKFSSFGTIFASASFTPKTSTWVEHYANIISDSKIIQNYFLHYFIIDCWCARATTTMCHHWHLLSLSYTGYTTIVHNLKLTVIFFFYTSHIPCFGT